MTFEYRNPFGDRLAVAPLGDVVSMKTTPGGCEVPPDRVEEVVAGIRDAARQASGQPAAILSAEDAAAAAAWATAHEKAAGTCPNCHHDRHLPGTECEAGVDHGPKRWHRCLCLARPGAALACPPQMTCQGGTLGYSDVWYLQHGHSLITEDGAISSEALKVDPHVPAAGQPDTQQTNRAAVLREVAAMFEAEVDDCPAVAGCPPCDVRNAFAARLRRMADEGAR